MSAVSLDVRLDFLERWEPDRFGVVAVGSSDMVATKSGNGELGSGLCADMPDAAKFARVGVVASSAAGFGGGWDCGCGGVRASFDSEEGTGDDVGISFVLGGLEDAFGVLTERKGDISGLVDSE